MKRQLKVLLAFSFAGLLGCAGLTIVVDPFFQYHTPLSGVHYVIDNQQSQNPGIARNFAYDSVILGSSMPDTVFTVFFPAYSVLHWNTEYAKGTWEAELDGTLQIMETLSEYSNVEIYYFQGMFDFITDLDNYSDASHYTKEMNDYMTACFASGEHRLYTVEECREAVKNFRNEIAGMNVLTLS